MTFIFNKEQHYYELDGKRMYGVTTVLGVIGKPMLIQWAANEAVKYVGSEWKPDITYSTEAIELILKAAKTAHRKKRDKAADVGTLVHGYIEKWIKDGCPDAPEPLQDAPGRTMFNHFREWAEKNRISFLASEKQVYSQKFWTAGTMDALIAKGDKKYILDVKTTSGIYDRTPFLQCAGYAMMLAESEGIEVDGYCIVRLGKDGSFEELWSYDVEGDKKGFLAALELFKQMETFKIK